MEYTYDNFEIKVICIYWSIGQMIKNSFWLSIWYNSDDLTFHLLRRIHILCAACENKVFGKNTLHEKYPCLLLLNIFEIHLREKFLQAATTQFQEIHNLMYLGHKYIHKYMYIHSSRYLSCEYDVI